MLMSRPRESAKRHKSLRVDLATPLVWQKVLLVRHFLPLKLQTLMAGVRLTAQQAYYCRLLIQRDTQMRGYLILQKYRTKGQASSS